MPGMICVDALCVSSMLVGAIIASLSGKRNKGEASRRSVKHYRLRVSVIADVLSSARDTQCARNLKNG